MKLPELQNKKIAILGFGQEGQSSLKFLVEQGIDDITVLDKNQVNLSLFLKGSTANQGGVKDITGEKYLDDLEQYDVIVKTPGISPFQDKIFPYRDKCISQTQIFFENYSGKIIGVTGTKGKSTISTLLYTCLEEAGYDVQLVGNIGAPVLDEIDVVSGEAHDYVIYELSSYMLQDFVPRLDIALLNNIYPCHLDWHRDFDTYKQAKVNLLKDTRHALINCELQGEVLSLLENHDSYDFFNGESGYHVLDMSFMKENDIIYRASDIRLQGAHNLKNISGVIGVLDYILQDREKLSEVLGNVLPTFKGLPHRIEDIGLYEGIRFINDAIATTPQSTMVAIETFGDELQTLFIGGEDSGFEFGQLREKILHSHIQNIIAFPDTGEKIFPEIELRDYEQAFEIEIAGKSIQMIKTRSMKQGVDFAYKTTLPGKIALLSCAAPSFSLWKSYTIKAQEFIKEVQEY